jgi:hypothetical protein
MPEVLFAPRYAIRPVRDPDPDWLRDLILDPFRPGREFGEARATFRDGDRTAELILIADRGLGYFLKWEPTGDTWLSLGDPSRLAEMVCPDDWQASAGLFVPAEKAWLAIHEFCRTGGRSSEVAWIRPEDVPAEGNW